MRSASWAALSGRSTGVDAARRSGDSTSTTVASIGEVVNMSTHTTPKASSDPMALAITSRVAPKVSESEELTLSTSPVGTRRPSRCPRRPVVWPTRFCVL